MKRLSPTATPNLGILPGSIQDSVLLITGEDPETVEELLKQLKVSIGQPVRHREFSTAPCSIAGASFTCSLTGLGSASVEVALNELFFGGARTFIHTGTAATLNSGKLPVGRPVIVRYAWRDDGASLHYVAGTHRRVSGHPELLERLRIAAEQLGIDVEYAVGVSTDAFYAGSAQARGGRLECPTLLPLRDGLVPVDFQEWMLPLLREDERYCLDMEVSTFYTLADLIEASAGVRWASVKGISNEIPFQPGQQTEHTERALKAALRVAIAAMTIG